MNKFQEHLQNLDLEATHSSIQSRFYDPLKKEFKFYRGLDGITFKHYMKDPSAKLQAVKRRMMRPSRALDAHGKPKTPSRFTFSPFEQFSVPKKAGSTETRPLSKAAINSIIAQRMLASYMTPILDPLFIDGSYAYRPKKSAKQAIIATQKAITSGYKWVLDADISKYFDNIDHGTLLEQVKTVFPGEASFQHLIYRFLKTGHVDITGYKKKRKLLGKIRSPKIAEKPGYVPRTKGIPQGGILSGLLANLYLHQFDTALKQHFPDTVYIRYADDFLIFAESEKQLILIKRYIRFYLRVALKLDLHPKKTHIREIGTYQEGKAEPFVDFLGYRICQKNKVKIQPQNIKAFKIKLREIVSEWVKSKEGVGKLITRINQKLKGRLYDFGIYGSYFVGKNWTAYFSLISHHGQLKELDDWLAGEIVRAARIKWEPKYTRLYLKNTKSPKLITLVGLHYKMLKETKRLKQLRAQQRITPLFSKV